MPKIARNFVDKSLWNSGNFAINNVNVPTVGEINAMFAAQGLSINYGSQDDLGKIICIAESQAADWSYSTNGTLYGGLYQLVQLSSAATTANAVAGLAAFTLDGTSNAGAQGYVVTDESHADAVTLIAGVFLNTITPGNFGFIQIHGKATVKYRAAVTDATIGDVVIVQGAGTGVFDSLAAGTAVTDTVMGKYVGNAIQLPVNASLKTIQMTTLRGRY